MLPAAGATLAPVPPCVIGTMPEKDMIPAGLIERGVNADDTNTPLTEGS